MPNFFSFWKKNKPDSKEGYSTGSIALFSELSPDEQALVEQHSRLVGFKRGDLVYSEGTAADAFYIIVSGRFRLFKGVRGSDQETTLFFFYRGEHFGETSLLTGNVHSASVEAKTDAVAFRIDGQSFQKLLKEIPALALYLSRSLGRHLTREDLGYRHHRREVRIAGFYFAAPTRAMAGFLTDFMKALRRETQRKTLILDLSGQLQGLLPEGFRRQDIPEFDLMTMDPSQESCIQGAVVSHEPCFDLLACAVNRALAEDEKKFTVLLTYLTYRYDYLLLCLPDRNTPVTVKALNYSDRVYLWAEKRTEIHTFVSKKQEELCQDFGFTKNEIKAILPSQGNRGFSQEHAAAEIQLFSMLPSLQYQRDQYEKTVTFLAKEWSERLFGLVLGSGAAYGLSHIGVLRVLEEEKIPVDIIAGSSIGALIGTLWAAGYDSCEIEKIVKPLDKKNIFFKLLGFRDISAIHRGFFKGNQIVQFLSSYLKDKTFLDLKIPVKMVATNLLTAEEVVLDSGNVLNAVRASISIPGFLRPYPYKGSYLLDGGIVDPLPVKVLSNLGVQKIMAVNVLPAPKDLIERNELRRKAFHQEFQRRGYWQRTFMKMFDRVQRRYTANIFNVMMNSIQFTEFEIARLAGGEADICIHACVPNAHWIEFFAVQKFIDQGIQKTRERLADIRQLLLE